VDPVALEYCRSDEFKATIRGYKGREVSWCFEAQDAVKLLDANANFDLIISNPPYIPTKEEVQGLTPSRKSSGFWEGVGLLTYMVRLILEDKCQSGAHLILVVTSLALKSPKVQEVLAAAPAKGVKVRVLVEREIAWKTFYAGPSELNYLLASSEEYNARQKIGDCEFYVGATKPGMSRTGENGRDRLFGYYWHFAYMLDIGRSK